MTSGNEQKYGSAGSSFIAPVIEEYYPGDNEQKDDPIHTIASGLTECFKNDPKKIVYWMTTANPNFGEFTPAQMIVRGDARRVAQFILGAMELNSGGKTDER